MKPHTIVFAGNPNVGKSTVFNAITGLKQHTGNWSGKTVDLAHGAFHWHDQDFIVYDIPGTYSVISNSPEEEIARDYICFENPDLTVVVADATCLERNLNLALQIIEMNPRVLFCVNLMDEARRKGIHIDLEQLQDHLGVPVIAISARKKQDIRRLKDCIAQNVETIGARTMHALRVTYPHPVEQAASMVTEELAHLCPQGTNCRFAALKLLDNDNMACKLMEHLSLSPESQLRLSRKAQEAKEFLNQQNISSVVLRDQIVESLVHSARQIAQNCTIWDKSPTESVTLKLDRYLTSRRWGIPIMLCFLGIILWITISGANVPSNLLSQGFAWLKIRLWNALTALGTPEFLLRLLVDGIYNTAAWVTAVMLPPMAIFFPLFTLLEDLGYLPRIAFNLDRYFKRVGSCGKQALTMCLGHSPDALYPCVYGCSVLHIEPTLTEIVPSPNPVRHGVPNQLNDRKGFRFC